MQYAPIIVFGFIRLDSLKQVIDGLLQNPEAKDSVLYIYLDGPRNEKDAVFCESVLNYCRTVCGFRKIILRESQQNKGLDPSIISGVTEVLAAEGRAIVLEDDVVPSSNFLAYMNQCLNVYEDDKRIMSISGFGVDIKKPNNYSLDVYMFGRSTSWGWATWYDRWKDIDWEIKDWKEFRHSWTRRHSFNKRGGSDMFSMLNNCMKGGGMWDIRFCYNMYKYNKYSIVPFISKVENIGFNKLAIHCKPVRHKRFTYTIDKTEKRFWNISSTIEPDNRIISERLKISSYRRRIIVKIKNILNI